MYKSLSALCLACASTASGSSTIPLPVLIEAYGDSTTLGWQSVGGQGHVTPNNTPAVTERILNAIPGVHVTIRNKGIGGTELSQLVSGTAGYPRTWPEEMTVSSARIVTVNFGLNDAYFAHIKAWQTSESPDEYGSLMKTVINTARQHGKIVVLFESTPSCEPVRGPFVSSYIAQLRAIAKSEHVPLVPVYDMVLSLPDWQSKFPDCLHPNDEIYEMRGRHAVDVLLPIIKSIQTHQEEASHRK